jgi:hypothetical protein
MRWVNDAKPVPLGVADEDLCGDRTLSGHASGLGVVGENGESETSSNADCEKPGGFRTDRRQWRPDSPVGPRSHKCP